MRTILTTRKIIKSTPIIVGIKSGDIKPVKLIVVGIKSGDIKPVRSIYTILSKNGCSVSYAPTVFK